MKHYTAMYSVLSSMNNCAEKWRYSEILKRYCTERIIQNKSKDASSLFKAVLLLEAQGLRLDSYMQYIELQREPEKRFWIPRRKCSLNLSAAQCKSLWTDELDILSISLPPGTGKVNSRNLPAFDDDRRVSRQLFPCFGTFGNAH